MPTFMHQISTDNHCVRRQQNTREKQQRRGLDQQPEPEQVPGNRINQGYPVGPPPVMITPDTLFLYYRAAHSRQSSIRMENQLQF